MSWAARFGLVFCAIMLAVTGFFAGFLTGASSSPVLAALLPIISGLVTVVGYNTLERQSRHRELTERQSKAIAAINQQLQSAGQPVLSQQAQSQLQDIFDNDPVSRWMPLAWSAGVILFVLVAFGAIYWGYKSWRDPNYPDFTTLMANENVCISEVPPEVFAYAHGLYLRSKASRLSKQDQKELVQHVIKPLLTNKAWGQGTTNKQVINSFLDAMKAYPETLVIPTSSTNVVLGQQ